LGLLNENHVAQFPPFEQRNVGIRRRQILPLTDALKKEDEEYSTSHQDGNRRSPVAFGYAFLRKYAQAFLGFSADDANDLA
jgi:hypothetical protein